MLPCGGLRGCRCRGHEVGHRHRSPVARRWTGASRERALVGVVSELIGERHGKDSSAGDCDLVLVGVDLAQHPPRARPDAPGHPGHRRRTGRAALGHHSRTEGHPGRPRTARAATVLGLHGAPRRLTLSGHSPPSPPASRPCSNTTHARPFCVFRRSTAVLGLACAHHLRKSGLTLEAVEKTLPPVGRSGASGEQRISVRDPVGPSGRPDMNSSAHADGESGVDIVGEATTATALVAVTCGSEQTSAC